ncbi:hypothetical protein Dret_2366 [Desulfohalobium retbaense DSM 5692]|uniref:Uncharacterized protein n=1 Tax=Desulfohalobium retbaense (strain ATCC 49708 / DSM 5692 / JCM 16813 / HR100) TaxID=485915 RepID=C8X5F2_DESRD|nr:hypothetical protein Dret_2366 [Desulfohalobium retbaense DSM 5692]
MGVLNFIMGCWESVFSLSAGGCVGPTPRDTRWASDPSVSTGPCSPPLAKGRGRGGVPSRGQSRWTATIEPSTPSPTLPLGKGEGAWTPSCRNFRVPIAEDTRSRPPFRRVSGSERAARRSYVRQWTGMQEEQRRCPVQIGIGIGIEIAVCAEFCTDCSISPATAAFSANT